MRNVSEKIKKVLCTLILAGAVVLTGVAPLAYVYTGEKSVTLTKSDIKVRRI